MPVTTIATSGQCPLILRNRFLSTLDGRLHQSCLSDRARPRRTTAAAYFYVSTENSYFRHILTLQSAKNEAARIEMWET